MVSAIGVRMDFRALRHLRPIISLGHQEHSRLSSNIFRTPRTKDSLA